MHTDPYMLVAVLTLGGILAAALSCGLDWWLQHGEQIRRDISEHIRLRRLERRVAQLTEDE